MDDGNKEQDLEAAFQKSRAKTHENNNNNDDDVLNGGDKQDLKNPARKSSSNVNDEQDLENPARKSSSNVNYVSNNNNEEDDNILSGGDDSNDSNDNNDNNEDEDDEDASNEDNKILSGGSDKEEHNDNDKEENNDIEYNIDYILEDDEKLIDIDNVKNQVDIYINNYNSEIMKKYRISFNKLYQKYSNKKYTIKILPVNNKNKSTKIVVVKNDKKDSNSIVTELVKPHYIYYNDEKFTLYNFKNKISNTRAELLYKYEILVSQINISPEDKLNFEKERNKFIKLLEEYYIYTLYHKKINKISTLNTTQLIIQSKYNISSTDSDNDKKNENMISILSGDTYTINNNIINEINTNNIDNLTKYNDIILQLTGKNNKEIKKDTKLIEEIKLYLNKSENVKLIKQLEESKMHQDNYTNYIISILPNE